MPDRKDGASFVLHEVTEEERLKYRESPTHSILKTPTAVFKTMDAGSAKRLTFADAGNGKEAPVEVANGDGEATTIEVAVSPTKSVRVSPQAWKAHQQLVRSYQDYANETEKTDYSYSPLSPYHGREIIPGVQMPPNMSRPAIRSFPHVWCDTPTMLRKYSPKLVSGNKLGNLNFWEEKKPNYSYWLILLLLVLAGFGINYWKPQTDNGILMLNTRVISALGRLKRIEQYIKEKEAQDNASTLRISTYLNELFRALEVEASRQKMRFMHCCRMNRNQYLLDYHKNLNLVMETKLKCKEVSEMHTNLLNALRQSNSSGEFFVQQAVKNVLRRYDADKTGLADYALETAGGRVVSIRCTQPWPGFEVQSFDPRAAIRSGVAPGECWAFQGEGRLVLELSHAVRVSGCSIEHISAMVHPEGFTASAPREFSLWGLEDINDPSPYLLGKFIYNLSAETVQTFSVNPTDLLFRFVELVISSNHGHPYTCLYRVRIHGSLS